MIDLERKNFAAAAYCFQVGDWAYSSWAEAHHNLGLAIHEGGWPAAAIEHYRRALTIRPDYAHSHVNLANALKLQGEVDEAIAHYRQALAAKPDFAGRCIIWGARFTRRGNIAKPRLVMSRLCIAPGFGRGS